MDHGELTKQAAIAALRTAAWSEEMTPDWEPVRIGDETLYRKVTLEPRRGIHSFAGFVGCDWDLADAEAFIQAARQVTWVDHWAGHCLAASDASGYTVAFDVPHPDPSDK